MYLCALAPWRETFFAGLSLSVALTLGTAVAEDVAVDTVFRDLQRPCGVAVRPGGTADRYDVFIADSGAGRVVRWSNLAPKQASEIVTGFKTHRVADPFHQTGPVALVFLDPGLLVVGTSRDNGGDLVRAYELPDDESLLSAEVDRESNSPRDGLDGATCSAMARSRANEFVPDMLVLAIRGANGLGRLMMARVQAGIVGRPRPFGAADAADSPRAVAVSNSGRILVGDAGGRLTFYNPIDGKVELALATDLNQLSGLAYSPTSGSLYAADFAGGIHRIDDASEPGRPACRSVQIADVSGPTALAFAPDGALYVVTFGSDKDDGTLEIITGDL
jgi:hypothetical protein